MRPVQNRAAAHRFPAQEQEAIDHFITAAPGLPLAECGGGIMKECLNMLIKPGKLALRQKMKQSHKAPFEFLACPTNLKINGDFKYFFNKRHEIIIGQTDENPSRTRAIRYYSSLVSTNPRWVSFLGAIEISLNLKNSNLIDFYGDLSLLYEVYVSTAWNRVSANSYIMDFSANRVRGLGMPAPSPLQPATVEDNPDMRFPENAAGIEYVEKDENGVAIRSSGIMRTISREEIFLFGLDFESADHVTHVRIWRSDDIGQLDNGVGEGHIDLLFLLAEIPVDVFSHEENRGLIINYTLANRYSVSLHHASELEPPLPGYDGLLPYAVIFQSLESNTQPSEVSFISTTGTLADINLVPMENACCYSGGRLWGIHNRKLIYSSLAGTIYQEQRRPMAAMDLGLGSINSIASLNGDLYVFSERGVSLLRESDPGTEANPNKPQNISSIGAIGTKTFSVDGFGIFALANDKLMFLDRSTLEYSKNCRGFDMNLYLGELVKEVSDFALHEGVLFFIAASRLFAFNMIDGYGISEFAMEDGNGGFVPEQLEYADGIGLAIVFKQLDINSGEHKASIWVYGGNAQPDEQETRYSAMFAKNAVYGFVEHWDTSVYAKLNPNAIIGTQDICDGVLYTKNAISMNAPDEEIDNPWEFRVVAAKEDGKRPIGKTIGVRVFIGHDPDTRLSQSEAEEAIYQLKLTTIKQSEVFRKSFNPNHKDRDYLATETLEKLLEE